MHLALVGIVGLALLFMLVEPLSWFRLFEGFEHVLDALETLFETVGKARQTAECYFPVLSVWDLVKLLHEIDYIS